jgi:hypothetical protein
MLMRCRRFGFEVQLIGFLYDAVIGVDVVHGTSTLTGDKRRAGKASALQLHLNFAAEVSHGDGMQAVEGVICG